MVIFKAEAIKSQNCPIRGKKKYHLLFRRDMEDLTGTLFCIPCTDDALESGLFTMETRNV